MQDYSAVFKNKKVIVTGGAGFIGSHICEALVGFGAEVYSLDDYSAGKEKNIAFLSAYSNFHPLRMDVTAVEGMDRVFDGASFVFHNAASKKNICMKDPKRDLRVNAEGTLNLLQYAHKHSVQRFIHASTGSVYGEPTIFPTTESHPLRPVSYYGVSKLAGERYVDVFNRLYGVNTTILRYFHVYGTRQESNEFGGVVSIFIRNILEGKPLIVSGDGTQVRSFTWVKDLVAANLAAATTEGAIGKAYNAASGIRVSINELAEGIARLMKVPSQIEFGPPLIGDIMEFDVSNKAIKEDLGVEFTQDFWGTLSRTLDEFKDYLGDSANVAAVLAH